MSNILPSQKTSVAEKKKLSFYKPTYDYYINLAISSKDTDKVLTCMNAANGIVDMTTFNYVMKPLGNTEDDFGKDLPGELRKTDFITPIKEKNLGEYIELPYKFFVKVNNPDAVLQRDNQLKLEIDKLMQQAYINLMNQAEGEGDVESKPVPDIKKFAEEFNQKWLDARAEKGQHILNLINDETDFDTLRIQDFYNWWSTEEFYVYRYIKNGGYFKESISPLDGFPISNGSIFNEDNDGFLIRRKISWNQFLDKYGDKISDKDRTYVEELTNSYSSTGALKTKVKFLKTRFGDSFDKSIASGFGGDEDDIAFETTNNDIDENILFWKTEEPIKLLTYQNPIGEIVEVEVANDYELDPAMGDISIRKESRQVVYEGVRIGPETVGLYLEPEKCLVQRYDKHSRTSKLPVGGKQGLLQGIPRNPVPLRIVPYLAMDSFLYLQIERTIAKYKSDIWVMPKSMLNPDEAGSSKEKYFYMLADNTLIYDDTLVDWNVATQGFRVVGNPGLERYLKVLIELRVQNKAEAWDLANMNEERNGAAANSQTVGNAQQNIYRAKLGSTLMITMFNKTLEREHQADLEFSKYAWINGKVGTYFDKVSNTPITVEVDPIDHLESDYGVFVRNSKAEERKFEDYRQLAFNASQNGDFELSSEAINAESTPELRQFVAEYSKAKREFEASQNQAKNDAIKYAADKMSEDKAADRASAEKIASEKNDTLIETTYINAVGFNDESKGGNTYSDADILQLAKDRREERKLALMEQAQKNKEQMDKDKLQIMKSKANKTTK